jgi:transposase-like protein
MDISEFAADYLVDKKEGLRHMTASLLNEVMQLEAQRQVQAQPYERNGKRRAHRNGTRNRNLKTIHGEVTLKKPQFREFPFRTEVFARYSRVESSVRVAVAESFLQGISRNINPEGSEGNARIRTGEYLRLRSLTNREKAG